ncbi:MAG: ribosome maturation factor RimP [Synergistaceae bacterium]|jgi:ribosome maturation factor RimP|nr:ribosome maturation factor RimP [Synergistaceae bacterium]
MISGNALAFLKKNVCETAENLGYECVGTEIARSGRGSVVRVYIDAPGGVRHEDCEKVSRALSDMIESSGGETLFPGKYFLEVSSPGLERPLYTQEHYRRFAGRYASLSLASGEKVTGQIMSCDGGVVVMRAQDDRDVSLPFGGIKKGNLAYIENKGVKKANKARGGK